MHRFVVPCALTLLAATAFAAPAKQAAKPAAEAPKEAGPDTSSWKEPVVTHHSVAAGGKTLNYTVTTGMMPLKSATGETEANIFFMAYTLDGVANRAQRPLMFSFNGGPGSASVWLHLGCVGPKRVKMRPDGTMPSPPYQLVDNPDTWLDQTDLVFIDPVGTGFSRATKPELGKKYWSVSGDVESVAEFIRMYLVRYQRWTSPLFLVGESYGTTRAAGLSEYLVDNGVALNGIVLVSSILNFETADFSRGNELPYSLFLPTYTAIAWYHKRLPADLQSKPLREVLDQSEAWTETSYAQILAKGDQLKGDERAAAIDQLARFTGLSKEYLDLDNLRPNIEQFCKQLERDKRRTVGRLDGRFEGIDDTATGEFPDNDPSLSAIRPPYTATFNQYIRSDLGWKTDAEYYILGGGIGRWDWGGGREGYPDVSGALRGAFSKNADMKLFIASGHYDLATPYHATQYTIDHLMLEPQERARVTMKQYEAGHMMYIDEVELGKLKKDVSEFISGALKPQPK